MLPSWRPNRARQTNRQHLSSQRRQLVFERLEDRNLLSVQPIPSENAGLLFPDHPVEDLQITSVVAADPNAALSLLGSGVASGAGATVAAKNSFNSQSAGRLVVVAPLGDGGAVLQPVVSSGAISEMALPGSYAQNRQNDNNCQQAPAQDDAETPPGDQNARKSPATEQSALGDQNSQALEQGDNLSGNDDTLKPCTDGQGNISAGEGGQVISARLLGAGNINTGHGALGLQNPFPSKASLRSDWLNAGTKLVTRGVLDVRSSAGNSADHGGILNVRGLSSEGAITCLAVNLLSEQLNFGLRLDVNRDLSPGGRAGWREVDSGFASKQEGFFEGVADWLNGSWTERIQYRHVGEGVAYTDTGTGQRNAFNPLSFNITVGRQFSVSASLDGTSRGPQHMQIDSQSAGTANGPQMLEKLAAPENELVEKAITGIGTLGNTLLVPAIAGSGTAPSAEFGHGNQAVVVGVAVFMEEAAPWQDVAAQAPPIEQHLANGPTSAAVAYQGDVLLSLQTIDSINRLQLLQSDVVSASPAPSGAGLAETSGATSVYLAHDEASVWSILTTYALVIMPRQRKYQPTILVVDPDDASREALNVVLVREGYFVLPAANVRDAWGMFRTPHARIDLVLMDPHLPDVSGIHLCARLRELSPTLPVMVCAGDVEPAEVAQLQQLGVRYYLRKPIAYEELLHTVKAILP